MKYQEIKIQECVCPFVCLFVCLTSLVISWNDQVPVGNIPCSMTIITRGGMTRLSSPGDHVLFTGVYNTFDDLNISI